MPLLVTVRVVRYDEIHEPVKFLCARSHEMVPKGKHHDYHDERDEETQEAQVISG